MRIRNDALDRYVWANIYFKIVAYKKGKPAEIVGIVKDLSYIDKITGIPNKAKFIEDAEELIHTHDEIYVLGILDLKNFKRFNDIHGYEQGDKLLKHIADMLLETVNEEESCAYFNADKFLLLLTFTSKESVIERVERLCRQIKAFVVQDDLKLTIAPRVGLLSMDE